MKSVFKGLHVVQKCTLLTNQAPLITIRFSLSGCQIYQYDLKQNLSTSVTSLRWYSTPVIRSGIRTGAVCSQICPNLNRSRQQLFHARKLLYTLDDLTSLHANKYNYSAKAPQKTNISAILKNQSALQVKRPARKKLPKMSDEGKTIQINNVVAYAVAEEIYLDKLETHLLKQGLYNIGSLPQDVTKALHVRGKYNVDQKPKEIFVFEDGSVVFWCVPEIERGAFLKMLTRYSHAPYLASLIWYEREELDFAYVNGKTGLNGDIIQLKQDGKDSQHRMLELYTFSNAMAQSVKLAIWEASFNNFIESIEKVTEDLRHGRKISMSRRDVLMKTGELFSLRHLINLSSDLLDTPDFYWDRSVLEPLYVSLCNYLNISRRTRVMNEKINHCSELTELLSSHLNDAHHTRLEIMIIVLILVEVIFEIVHSLERYIDRSVTTAEAPSASQTSGEK